MYTADSPILGSGTVSAKAIDAFFAVVGRERAAESAPDGVYLAPPPGIGAAIIAAAQRWSKRPNYVLMAAQAIHETGGWQSGWARTHNNPAGIGVDGTPGKGEHFDTMQAGFDAQVAHLLNYAVGRGEWSATDRRYPFNMPAGYLGVAPTLRGLNGRWATPGMTYAQEIAALANRLVEFAEHGSWGNMAGDDSRFLWKPDTSEFGYPQGAHGRNGKPVDYLIIHVTEGTDSAAWLRGGHGSSTHYLTNRDATPREQHVAEADAAWTAGSREYNLRSINIEFERFARDAWTDAELANAIVTCAPILTRNSIPLVFLGRDSAGRRGILGHEHVPDGAGGWGGSTHHTDPGAKFPWERFIAGLRMAMGNEPTPDPANNPLYFPQTNKYLDPDFATFWNEHGGVAVLGYPVTGSFVDGDMKVQYTERAVLELHPDGVKLRRLGAAAAAAAGFSGPGIP